DQTPQGKRAKNTFSDEAYTLPTLSLTPSDQTDQSLDHSDDSILESPLKNRHSHHRKDPVTPKRPSAHSVTRQVGSPLKQTHTKAKGNAQKTQDPSQSSIRTHLQGFGPHTSRQVNETDMDHRVSSLVQDGPPKQHKGASIWWKYVYPLENQTFEMVSYGLVAGFAMPLLIQTPALSAYERLNEKFIKLIVLKNRSWTVWQNGGGTLSNIPRHIASNHKELAHQLGLSSKGSRLGGDTMPPAFNLETAVEKMITWIISDDQAMQVVESQEFREMIKAFNPTLIDGDIPGRGTIRHRILTRYKQDRQELKQQLKDALGRISLTADLWSSSTMKSFMAVTVHWTARMPDGELTLKTALGGFRYIRDKHDGHNIATHLVKILEELDILNRVGAITLDNASSNDSAMSYLKDFFQARGVEFNCKQQRVWCFSHVINIAVQELLAVLPEPDKFQLRHITDNSLKSIYRQGKREKAYADILKTNLVERIAGLIKQLRSSGQRREGVGFIRECVLSSLALRSL
ncbi:13277_t:CDS:2, partial [Acaulospora colombiana]